MRLGPVCAVVLAACRTPPPIPSAQADEAPQAERPEDSGVDKGGGAPGARAAVVELFTSEGCSSCPPADNVLADIVRGSQRVGGRPVYALAFHVDYWDGIGWPDRFASADYAARQRLYARSFGTSSLYTPQMIVDGTVQFTGSDGERASEAIARAQGSSAPRVLVTVRARAAGPRAVAVDYDAPGAPPGAVLNIAVVERSTSTNVRAGENAGHELHHTNVVRALSVVSLRESSGSTTLVLSSPPRGEAGSVIAYVQTPSRDGGGMPILGATESPLPP